MLSKMTEKSTKHPFRFFTEQDTSDGSSVFRFSTQERAVMEVKKAFESIGIMTDVARKNAEYLKSIPQYTHMNPLLLAVSFQLWNNTLNRNFGNFSRIGESDYYTFLLNKKANRSPDTIMGIKKDILRYMAAIYELELGSETTAERNERERKGGKAPPGIMQLIDRIPSKTLTLDILPRSSSGQPSLIIPTPTPTPSIIIPLNLSFSEPISISSFR
jgi:hypothetical protein